MIIYCLIKSQQNSDDSDKQFIKTLLTQNKTTKRKVDYLEIIPKHGCLIIF